jgi:surface protein
MFNSCTKFNQDISTWDTTKVTSMYYMFADCTEFDKNIRYFVVADTTVLTNMFLGAKAMIETYGNVPVFGSEDNNYTPTYEFFNQN